MWKKIVEWLFWIIGLSNLLILFIVFPLIKYDGTVIVYEKYRDALHMAMELGRLDAISLLLTVFGILLAILALVGFGYIENRAVAMAKETANAYSIEFYKQQEIEFYKQKEDKVAQDSAIIAARPIIAGEVSTEDVVLERGGDGNV